MICCPLFFSITEEFFFLRRTDIYFSLMETILFAGKVNQKVEPSPSCEKTPILPPK